MFPNKVNEILSLYDCEFLCAMYYSELPNKQGDRNKRAFVA